MLSFCFLQVFFQIILSTPAYIWLLHSLQFIGSMLSLDVSYLLTGHVKSNAGIFQQYWVHQVRKVRLQVRPIKNALICSVS
jgi:hypothetical protein